MIHTFILTFSELGNGPKISIAINSSGLDFKFSYWHLLRYVEVKTLAVIIGCVMELIHLCKLKGYLIWVYMTRRSFCLSWYGRVLGRVYKLLSKATRISLFTGLIDWIKSYIYSILIIIIFVRWKFNVVDSSLSFALFSIFKENKWSSVSLASVFNSVCNTAWADWLCFYWRALLFSFAKKWFFAFIV